ncbi:MAG: DUF2804 family protein [Myxococcales bacterium]|nr:DUF2804 family protein [Myxococcales bacterium]
MRTLSPAPTSLFDPAAGTLRHGSFEGPLPAFDARAAGRLRRVATRKAWLYGAVTTDELWISFCVVHLGYASNAFVFVYDVARGAMLVDRTAIAAPWQARVGDDPHRPGPLATFRGRGLSLSTSCDGASLVVSARSTDVDLDARLSAAAAPPAISAIASLGGGRYNTTEKRAPLTVTGRARVGARDVPLDGALGGYDYTCGLLERRTRWRWAFGLGAVDGEPFAFNLVQGFVGEAECAAFADGRVTPLAEAAIEVGSPSPEDPWRVRGDGYDLTFLPGGVHAQHTNLGVVRSKFIQPVGTFSGTMRVGDRERTLEALPGVVEDQDVVW